MYYVQGLLWEALSGDVRRNGDGGGTGGDGDGADGIKTTEAATGTRESRGTKPERLSSRCNSNCGKPRVVCNSMNSCSSASALSSSLECASLSSIAVGAVLHVAPPWGPDAFLHHVIVRMIFG